MKTLAIELPMDEIRDFCRKWRIRELAVFGSVLTDEFDDESDIDFLYTFEDDARWGLFKVGAMYMALAELLGREIAFVSKRAIENSDNPYRKREILNSYEVIFTSL